MTFIHHDPESPDLLRIVTEARQIPVSLIEKDYWVTHTLWALQDLGLEVWFKVGTSLSKGFNLIQRFSEDLDLKLEGGKRDLPAVRNWKSKERAPLAERRAFSRPSLPCPWSTCNFDWTRPPWASDAPMPESRPDTLGTFRPAFLRRCALSSCWKLVLPGFAPSSSAPSVPGSMITSTSRASPRNSFRTGLPV